MTKKNFQFIGKAPLSKSLLNRALIVKSWYPNFVIHGSSLCDDILVMDSAVKRVKQKKEFYCGLSGTAFRFLAVRLSREKGEFLLKAEPAIFKRPLEEASSLLSQLSVSIEKMEQYYRISSEGWKLQGDCVYVPYQVTSQWASALLLNSWNLDQDLYFVFNQSLVSYAYFKMTLDFVQSLGLVVQQKGDEFFIPKGQNLKKKEYHPEQDKSCLFALACFAVLKGQAVFLNWEEKSLQADHIFRDILKTMGVSVKLKKDRLVISKCDNLKALNISLKEQPDLFPMLAVLCAKAEGLSALKGVSHLAFKESNRLQKIKELLENCGIRVSAQKNDFLIYGQKEWDSKISPFVFDTEQDHRLVMAGELIAVMDAPITLKGKDSVNKSFPEFYSFIQS